MQSLQAFTDNSAAYCENKRRKIDLNPIYLPKDFWKHIIEIALCSQPLDQLSNYRLVSLEWFDVCKNVVFDPLSKQASSTYNAIIKTICEPMSNPLFSVKEDHWMAVYRRNQKCVEYKVNVDSYKDLCFDDYSRGNKSLFRTSLESWRQVPALSNISGVNGTPLCFAIKCNNFEAAKDIIKIGADVNAASYCYSPGEKNIDLKGTYITALHEILLYSPLWLDLPRCKMVQLLILKGGKVGLNISSRKKNSIVNAVERLYREVFSKLYVINMQSTLDRPCLNRDVIRHIFDQYILYKLEELSTPFESFAEFESDAEAETASSFESDAEFSTSFESDEESATSFESDE